jgi:hypothetical protein
MDTCSSCGKHGVKINVKRDCGKCKRTNFYCIGCSATALAYGGRFLCKCTRKDRAKRKGVGLPVSFA